ncbi:Drug resistance transporter, EmrB/QacA subfamily OS=Tsukamurella paurometabola (strain ATCC 8368 /DSM / CCUG 35730 / CIP 100753 / JCM 10117 / KCTC 9821/ NBRC 16120 / NCIMB 702349 / NCTC 13040) OX=521096 GN=Tpau_0954 PE=4 SV=1 [Tsukamurella paurometabola]|uniref:Drug resistance transporter, EmrB/QacA subfamily n=1 Tax=Tsukamurella paurometabola (strain ATCC 8368 / DSM 20162 / CCUG 35730 / CIP 100753 / JCM 10117 / KCTC 9821 / NBRC 16120 / NCIMB 702349 / NCTC 13040) TaxID=521096 RepID=D5UUL6_TSUPD|nr:MFS transporter [Tsukamurella paurometabola]ADG77587.1 drug resistance transporter, EmrB/QacA subfamily [Tsukamurella paurometabola DSM 20162]SUP27826.1 Spectinomycin tetracycline efflux pump [Tsukamurella paurometabola]
MSTTISGLSSRRKQLVLLTCSLSLLIVSMDATIVNVALPSIRTDMSATVQQLQWVVDVYTLTLAGLLVLAGAGADRFGRRRVFRIGLAAFAVGSLLCSLAPTVEVLIAARFTQAVGGSMLNPVAMSIITATFTGRVERARAIGVWGAVVGISTALGPLVGGVLIETLGWRSVFWINLPICTLALGLTFLVVPESRAARIRSIDPMGLVLAVAVVFSLVFGLIEEQPLVFLGTAAVLAAFVLHERRHPSPFLDLRFFRSIPFSAATLTAVCAFAGFGAFLFTMSIYLQDTRHLSAVQAGVMFLPMALAVLVCSPVSGRMVATFGARPSLVGAGVLMTTGAASLTAVHPGTPLPLIAFAFAVFGGGFGLVNAPITNSAVNGMPLDRAGAAAALASTSRQVGVSIGVALAGISAGAQLWWIIAGATTCVLALGVISTGPAAARSVERITPLLDDRRAADVR